jgi:hypothetical protein
VLRAQQVDGRWCCRLDADVDAAAMQGCSYIMVSIMESCCLTAEGQRSWWVALAAWKLAIQTLPCYLL